MPEPKRPRLLLIGWDAADWRVINPLLDAGLMPTLKSLVERGVMGNLATLTPPLSPMLWNSIATGKRADKHGILGFIEPRPDGSGVQPVSSTSRTTRALWNIANLRGLRSQVYNWYASHPAEPINGIVVTDLFPKNNGADGPLAPLPEGAIHPPCLRDEFESLRVRPDEITGFDLAPFIPRLGEIPEEETAPVVRLRSVLADCASLHAAVTHGLANHPWDFAAVYYDAIDHTCHTFMPHRPPRMPHVDPRRFEWFKDVVDGMYRFHDMMLQALLEIAGPQTTVVLVSDHGFHSGRTRPVHTPGHVVGPAVHHRELGIVVLAGDNLKRDERIYGGTLLDIAPTVLTLMGLPVGQDMDGKVLVNAFERPPKLERVPSWDREPGDAGEHQAEQRLDPLAAAEALRQLVDLGYIAEPTEDAARNIDIAVTESRYNLACVHIDAERFDDAAKLLDELLAKHPQEQRFAVTQAEVLLRLGKLAEARALVESISRDHPPTGFLLLLHAVLHLVENRRDEALRLLDRAAQLEPDNPTIHCQSGAIHLRRRDYPSARRSFARAAEIEPDSPLAYYGLARVALHEGRTDDAITLSLRAVGLQHFFPVGHLTLGLACARAGQLERAVEALRVCVSMRPQMLSAHRYLAWLYRRMNRPADAFRHREIARAMHERQRGGGTPTP